MISTIINDFRVQDWTFLNIDSDTLKARYSWLILSAPGVEKRFPWAVEYDLIRLFHLCISFPSSHQALDFLTKDLRIGLNSIHLDLLEIFCYPTNPVKMELDELIESSADDALLKFTLATIDRALIWWCPESSWKSDFFWMMAKARRIIDENGLATARRVDYINILDWDYNSSYEHTHVYYRFYNISKQLENGEVFSDLGAIAKQAHIALMTSIDDFYEHKWSRLSQIDFDKKVDEVMGRETLWCTRMIGECAEWMP